MRSERWLAVTSTTTTANAAASQNERRYDSTKASSASGTVHQTQAGSVKRRMRAASTNSRNISISQFATGS